jgi:hypothetical protein
VFNRLHAGLLVWASIEIMSVVNCEIIRYANINRKKQSLFEADSFHCFVKEYMRPAFRPYECCGYLHSPHRSYSNCIVMNVVF